MLLAPSMQRSRITNTKKSWIFVLYNLERSHVSVVVYGSIRPMSSKLLQCSHLGSRIDPAALLAYIRHQQAGRWTISTGHHFFSSSIIIITTSDPGRHNNSPSPTDLPSLSLETNLRCVRPYRVHYYYI
jgi:hypothetical protein